MHAVYKNLDSKTIPFGSWKFGRLEVYRRHLQNKNEIKSVKTKQNKKPQYWTGGHISIRHTKNSPLRYVVEFANILKNPCDV